MKKSFYQVLIMNSERKMKSFNFDISFNLKKTDIFGITNIDKYLKL